MQVLLFGGGVPFTFSLHLSGSQFSDFSSPMSKRLFIALGLIILLTGAAFRIAGLGPRSLWIDELLTRDVARLPFWKPDMMTAKDPVTHSIMSFALHDQGPGPLVYLLEGFFANRAQPLGREFWIRVPAAFAGILSLMIFLVFGPRWTGGRAGALVLAAAAAAIPLAVEWSTSARGYAWGLLIVISSLGLLVDLSRPSREKPTAPWLAFLVLFTAGWMLNPLMTFWNAGLLCGILYARLAFLRSRMAAIRPALFWSGLALALAAHAAYFATWLIGTHYFQTPSPAGASLRDTITPFLRQLIDSPYEGASELAVLLIPAAVILLWRRQRLHPALVAILIACLAHLPVFAMLLKDHFLASRYFFALIGSMMFLIACLAQMACVRVRTCRSRRAANILVIITVATILLLPARESFRVAITPVHDWSSAVRFVKSRLQPGDIILAGPNADMAMLLEYAQATGIPRSSVPLIFAGGANGPYYDFSTESALSIALRAQTRVWYITPFWGQIRSPDYWKLADTTFREAASFPGHQTIRVMLHEPAPAAKQP